jgi:hypothetical protein
VSGAFKPTANELVVETWNWTRVFSAIPSRRGELAISRLAPERRVDDVDTLLAGDRPDDVASAVALGCVVDFATS